MHAGIHVSTSRAKLRNYCDAAITISVILLKKHPAESPVEALLGVLVMVARH